MNRETYIAPDDVRFLLKAFPVTSVQFSKALLKARYDQMDSAAQQRAEKTLLYFKTGKLYK